MRTLTLRCGARVVVDSGDTGEWSRALGVVVSGRVQLELRDGEPGPVLGPDTSFWLRGTGVRALRNTGQDTVTLHVITPVRP